MRPIHVIAQDIRQDWKKPHFGAVPYLKAMGELTDMTDMYGYDPAPSIIAYFLSNAKSWRGPVATTLKLELNIMLRMGLKRNYSRFLEYNGFERDTERNPIRVAGLETPCFTRK